MYFLIPDITCRTYRMMPGLSHYPPLFKNAPLSPEEITNVRLGSSLFFANKEAIVKFHCDTHPLLDNGSRCLFSFMAYGIYLNWKPSTLMSPLSIEFLLIL